MYRLKFTLGILAVVVVVLMLVGALYCFATHLTPTGELTDVLSAVLFGTSVIIGRAGCVVMIQMAEDFLE